MPVTTRNTSGAAGSSGASASHVVAAGDNRFLIAYALANSNSAYPTLNSFTCNGVAMTPVINVNTIYGATRHTHSIYYALAPAVGTLAVACNYTTSDVRMRVVDYTGVNQVTPVSVKGAYGQTTATQDSRTITPTFANGISKMLSTMMVTAGGSILAVAGDLTNRGEYYAYTFDIAMGDATPNGNVNCAWTWGSTQWYYHNIIEILPFMGQNCRIMGWW